MSISLHATGFEVLKTLNQHTQRRTIPDIDTWYSALQEHIAVAMSLTLPMAIPTQNAAPCKVPDASLYSRSKQPRTLS